MNPAERRSLAAQGAVGLASFLTPFTYGALSVAMPTIGREFDYSAREMAMVMMVHILFSTALVLPVGRASDYVGRKGIFMCGSLLFTASSLMAGLSSGPWALLAARALQGVGDALTFGVSGAILVSIVPPERTGRAIGFNLTFIFAGLALGPLVGGVITSLLSWRVIFFLSAAAGVAAFALIRRGYADEHQGRGRLPWRDAALFVPAMLGLILGISIQPSLWGALLAVAAGVLLKVFLVREEAAEKPLVDVRYVKGNQPFALSNLAALTGYAAAFSTSFLLSLLLQSVMGLSPSEAGYLLLVMPTVQAFTSPLAGMLSDRMHPARAAAAGLVVLGLGLWALAFTDRMSEAWILWSQVALGFGFSLFVSPNFNAIMASSDPSHKGMASGFMATMRGLGMCLSLSVTGLVLSLMLGTAGAAQAGPQTLPALKVCFGVFGACALASAVASWRAGSRPNR